jgi:hypothetical protein
VRATHSSHTGLVIRRSDDEYRVVLLDQFIVKSSNVCCTETIVIGKDDVEMSGDGASCQSKQGEQSRGRLHLQRSMQVEKFEVIRPPTLPVMSILIGFYI